jgi:hypothetical protein
MEFVRRIGELAYLTRRLNRVRAENARARRLLASSRFALPHDTSAVDNVTGENGEGRLFVARRRQYRRALASPDALSRGARVQDQLLARRIPIAVSLVERSWCKLDRRQRERDEKQRHWLHEPTTAASVSGFLGGGGAEKGRLLAASHSSTLSQMALRSSSTEARPRSCGDEPQSIRELANSADTQQTRRNCTPAPRQQLEAVYLLLQLLHSIEQARRQHLQEKQSAAQRRSAMAESVWRRFQKDFATQLHQRRPTAKQQSGAETLSAADAALLRETADTLQRRRRVARDDLALLQSSLLARPFVSAQLWRLLLREPVWVAAVAEHKRAAAQCNHSSRAQPPDVTQLLFCCLALARISMGVLRDYVQGGQLSRQAPRFVVSLPSRIHLARLGDAAETVKSTKPSGTEDVEKVKEVEGLSSGAPTPSSPHPVEEQLEATPDVVLSMLQSAAETAALPASSTDEARRTSSAVSSAAVPHKRSGFTMRWIPPHTAEVLPLVENTLALHAFVLPELDISVLLQRGCAPELVHLCVTLQHLATATLALSQDRGDKGESSSTLHRTLHALNGALRAVGALVVAHLVEECQAPSQEVSRVAGRRHRTPDDAARLAVQLHGLRQLPTGDAGVAALLSTLLIDVFPELRTQTSRVLHHKARQSSLLAFATRPHRHKLLQQHGRKNAETFLLETVVQQARLQQRQLAAVLREQYVTEAHVQALRALGQSLSLSELIQLFQLYARHIAEAGRSEVGWKPSSSQEDLWVTGCLFLAEAVLLRGNVQHDDPEEPQYTVSELATLWNASAVLFPHIRTRRARQVAQQKAVAAPPGRPRVASSAHTESLIWATFAEHVLSGVNAALARRLQWLEERRQSEATAMRRGGQGAQKSTHNVPPEETAELSLASQPLSINSVVALVTGVLEYALQDEALRESIGGSAITGSSPNAHAPSSLQPIRQSVRILSHLLHELVLHDRPLWHQMRSLPTAQRDAVEQQLRECFHSFGMLDGTTARALSELNREEDVDV